jgi:hypothetical protein
MTVTAVAADVAAWSDLTDTVIDTAELDRVFAAAVGRLGDDYDLDAADADRADLAVIMYAARLYARKDSVNGIAANAEWGAIRVSVTDPDVHALIAKWEVIRFG